MFVKSQKIDMMIKMMLKYNGCKMPSNCIDFDDCFREDNNYLYFYFNYDKTGCNGTTSVYVERKRK